MARLLVFTTSAAVLVLEILAGRLLAPYLGVSLEVFTGIIGVVLAGISLGAWLGGRAADRHQPTTLLGPLLVAGGLAALAAPLIIDLVGPRAEGGPVSIVALTAVGFFLPAALLSAVPPVVVKARLASLDQTGSVVGSYSAIGTAGAIFGTFATGFILIAAFPTRPIVLGVGILLVVGGLLLWRGGRSARVATLLLALALGSMLAAVDGPCDYETTYHCAIVQADTVRPAGRLLILDRGFNSYVDLDDPTYLEFRYLEAISDVVDAEAPEGPIDVVSIGGGGFTFPRYLAATRPGTNHLVLEIDRELLDIGRRDLGFDDEAEVVIDDARRSLKDVAPESLDLVVGDAFSGLSVPWHLTTSEFVAEIGARLRSDGVYAMNVIDYYEAPFARSATASLLEVFDNVAVIAPSSYFDGTDGGNFVLVGSKGPLDITAIERQIVSRTGSEVVLTGGELDLFVGDARPLRDDFAPVDQMLDWHY
jgi:spermidine synthase